VVRLPGLRVNVFNVEAHMPLGTDQPSPPGVALFVTGPEAVVLQDGEQPAQGCSATIIPEANDN